MSLLDEPLFVADVAAGLSERVLAAKWGRSRSTIHKWVIRARRGEVKSAVAPVESEQHEPGKGDAYTRFSQVAWGYEDHREFIRSRGQDPDAVTFGWGWTSNPDGGFWNKIWNVRPVVGTAAGPAWPVIQPAQPVTVEPRRVVNVVPRVSGMKLAAKCSDHQIGFRALPDGTFDPFHDERSMALFVEVCAQYQPDKIHVLGDFLDLPSQSRWVQEASFARTTQMALDAGHRWLAELRAVCPDAEIVMVEGNHDKRMQSFIESNALAAFGLRKAGLPESWPVMSLPNLLRLDDLNVRYVDAYPAATDWDNATTRNIHGVKANSKGSTTSQYVHELPHINTWAGHSHRPEITFRSVVGAFGEAVERYSANPGCMCRTDGATPSVNGAVGADGVPARVVENWQNGFGLLYFNDSESWPQVYRILDGRALVDGRMLSA